MKRLRFTPEAELDFDEAHLWYHEQAPRRATDFLAAVDTCIASIQRHPRPTPWSTPPTRRALVRRFPYGIFYEIGYSVIAASGFLGALPAVMLVLVLQEYMVQGLTARSVKG